VVRLRAGDIDSTQMIIRIVQSKGRKSLMNPSKMTQSGPDAGSVGAEQLRPRA
jgi:hypothetical protein